MSRTRSAPLSAALALLPLTLLAGHPASVSAETVLRIAMTASDIPATNGAPDQGAEGWRTAGTTIYDSLVQFDLSSADKPAVLKPGLATDWSVDPTDSKRWTFHLRKGVKFHDGSDWNADAAIWNLDSMLKKDAPQYDARRYGQTLGKLNSIASYRKVDDNTIEIVTHAPDAILPYDLVIFWQASPAQFAKAGNWNAFAQHPSGTGPWKLDRLVPRERLELVANHDYWDPARRPKTDRLVFIPTPEPSARSAALLSGQVDWEEAPDPDSLSELKGRGFKVVTNSYPHVWGWYFSELPGSPFADVRVRQALNYGIDRDAIVALLSGTATPATGVVAEDSAWFGQPQQRYKYDPERAKKLLAEAGYGPSKPLAFNVLISTSGSGQMQPLPMNSALQQQLAAINVKVEFNVLDWNTLRTRRGMGAKVPDNAGALGLNNSWTWQDPDFGLLGTSMSSRVTPTGLNWGYVNDPKLDALGARILDTFDPKAQDLLIAQFHARMVDQADWLYVVHDLNARAMSSHVTGFVQARSWLQDFTSVKMQ